jgi:hypothetical protein
VLNAGDMVQKALDFVGGKDDGEFCFSQGNSKVTRYRNWTAETKVLMD